MKSYNLFLFRNLTFNFSLFISIIIHLFLFSLFYIESLISVIPKSEQTKIAFISDSFALFGQEDYNNIYDIKNLNPIDKIKDINNDKKIFDLPSFLKEEKKIKYKKDKEEKIINKDFFIKPEIKVNSHRKVLRLYYPSYPLWAKKLHLESELKVAIKINKDGFVQDIVFDQMSNHSELDAIALRSITRWKFQPVLSESNVDQWADVVFKFKLD